MKWKIKSKWIEMEHGLYSVQDGTLYGAMEWADCHEDSFGEVSDLTSLSQEERDELTEVLWFEYKYLLGADEFV